MIVNKELIVGLAIALSLAAGPQQARGSSHAHEPDRWPGSVTLGNNCRGNHNGPGGNAVPAGALITPTYGQARAFLGRTPEEVHQKFAAIQEMNFTQGNASAIISRLSDAELEKLADHYGRSAVAGESDLLRILAQRLNSDSLLRVAHAFGGDVTEQAVMKYASASVAEDFERHFPNVQSAFAKANSAEAMTTGSPAPNTDMTLEEIYLDYRTAPVGSLSVGSALVQTTIYAGTALYLSWNAGYAFGTGIHLLIEKYDPEFDNVLGGTIDSAIQNIALATSEFQQGQYEQSADSLFGFDLKNTGSYYGDWNTGDSYADFIFTSNKCN